jgi:hypothetical protein
MIQSFIGRSLAGITQFDPFDLIWRPSLFPVQTFNVLYPILAA